MTRPFRFKALKARARNRPRWGVGWLRQAMQSAERDGDDVTKAELQARLKERLSDKEKSDRNEGSRIDPEISRDKQ